ncbi:hypothetical protein N2152v2_008931 [Parachlorella kessleri]
MSPQRGFWASLFGAAERDRFSVEELRHLHGVLLRNQVVTDSNRDTVVEALRCIAELVIWGDQHDPSVVEYFLTENLLAYFNQILQQRSNRRGNVATQVLQTLSILIQNVRNQQTVYYLFSNNHINEIVTMRFDFEDDEVLGYYVNLLKTISLKLNEVTVQFFFQQLPGGGASFPLYTEAVKFVNHRDGMVRTAVKTLTLNVYAIPLPAVQHFVTQPTASNYLQELVAYMAEQCQVLDRLLSSWDVASPQAPASLESCLAEIEDLLSYCNDVLCTGVPVLRQLLLDCLWRSFVGPVLFWPLIQEDVAAQHIATLTLGLARTRATAPVHANAAPTAGPNVLNGLPKAVERGIVGPLCSLYVLERLLYAVTDRPLLSTVLAALLGGSAAGVLPPPSPSGTEGSCAGSHPGSPADSFSYVLSASLAQQQQQQLGVDSAAAHSTPAPSARGRRGHQPPVLELRGVAAEEAALAAASLDVGQPEQGVALPLPTRLLVRLQYSPAAYRAAFMGMLRGSDAQLAAAAVRVLAALVHSRAVTEELLELMGLLPRRRRKQRQLLAALTAGASLSSPVPSPAPSLAAPAAERDLQLPPAALADSASQLTEGAAMEVAVGEAGATQAEAASAGAAAVGASVPPSLPLYEPSSATADANASGSEAMSGSNSIDEASASGALSGSEAAAVEGSVAGASPHSPVEGQAVARLATHDSAASSPHARSPRAGSLAGDAEQEASTPELVGAAAQPSRSTSPSLPGPTAIDPAHLTPHMQQQAGPGRSSGPSSQSQTEGSHNARGVTMFVELASGSMDDAYGEAQFAEVASSLLGLLGCDLLPPLAILTLGWLLNKLLSVGKAGAELAPSQAALVAAALRQAQLAAQAQVHGPWCDVLGPLVEREWGRSRQSVLHTGAGSVHVAVHTWMQGVLVQELRWQLLDQKEGDEEGPAANAATAAKIAYLAMHTLVALTQIQQLLLGGEVPPHPPIALPPAHQQQKQQASAVSSVPSGAAVPPSGEVTEGSHILLSHRLSCMVAFSRGQERKVYFAVEGLPGYVEGGGPVNAATGALSQSNVSSEESKITVVGKAAAVGSDALAAPAAATPAAAEPLRTGISSRHSSMAERLAWVKPEALAAAAAAAVPVVVVADPGTRPNTGVVLSAAPLLGTCPRVDEQHPRWLHVRVRPQARAVLRVVAASNPGMVLLNLERQLVAGHWVLAFPKAEEAAAARELVEESARGMRELYRHVLLPLLGPAG